MAHELLQSQYPNCKILLVGIQKTYVGHGLEPSEIRSYHAFCSQLNRVYKDIATNPLYAPYVRFLQMSAQFNSQTGHKLALSDANEYSDEEITYCTDFVHPSPTFGAKMWGDAIWRGFVGLTHMP